MEENTWRLTAMPARFFFVDCRAAIFIPPMLLYLRPVTIMAFVAACVVLKLLERQGYTVPVALRILRLMVVSRGRFPLRVIPYRPQPFIWRLRRKHL